MAAAAGNTTAVVAIRTDFGYGSGVVVGPHEILTASHMVWSNSAHRSTSSFAFSAGISGGMVVQTSRLDGEVTSEAYASSIRFNRLDTTGAVITTAQSQSDFALITVAADLSSYEKALLSPVAVGGELHITGYPYWAYGLQVDATATVSVNPRYSVLDFYSPYVAAGNSGGPVWREENGRKIVVGIESAGGNGYHTAARIDGANYNQVQTWIAEGQAALGQSSVVIPAERPAANSNLSNYFGSTASETITGTSGRDFFFGSRGSDRISAGAGFDTVIYEAGSRKDYVVTAAGGVVTVNKGPLGGTDTLTDVQRIQFTDAVIGFDVTGDSGYGYRLYQAAFNRTPDRAGLSFWVKELDRGVALKDVAAGFAASAEFKATYGANPAPRQIVETFYKNILGRTGEPTGVAAWTAELSGKSTVGQVLVGFSESQENITKLAGVLANGVTMDLI